MPSSNPKAVQAAVLRLVKKRGRDWLVPFDATYNLVATRYAGHLTDDILTEIERRYIGWFDGILSLAHHLAERAFPPQEVVGAFGIDFEAWPFNHINWAEAANQLDWSIITGTLVETAGGHYFDFGD